MILGLQTLHDLKIIHRDIKCANIFLTKSGTVKLGDLNVSKVAKRGMLSTQTGTPYYASPEVWMDKPYNFKSDIWSLGCVLYEMITGKPPFLAKDMQGLYKAVI
jgi:NIMA (never in mitosis gene a)-related kinase